MKVIKKILILVIFTAIFVVTNNCYVSADPNSSKGFAEYDDTKAKQENEKMVEEQENKFDAEKSTNNYLESLQVEGYELYPEFDKQTLEYTIDKEITSNEINIKATVSDSKATINGIGNVKLEDNQNQCRVDVTSESGTVRTYIIKIKRAETVEENNGEQENEIVQDTVEENQNAIVETYSQRDNEDLKQDNKFIFIILGIVVLIIVILIVIKLVTSKKEKGKHEK